MDKLTGQQCNLQIIPIVGMGGIGKTTLARNIYAKQLIKEHFDICAWATISQEYLAITSGSKFASSVTLLWNLHTLIIHQYSGSALFEIWELSQLRHVKAYRLSLLDPSSGRDDIVLENQQTLRKILNFECGEEDLTIIVSLILTVYVNSHPFVNLGQNITFPSSLMKLTLEMNSSQFRDDVLEKVGVLPRLEKLKLMYGSFRRRKWETVEGQFVSLKFL
ncbi:hypothetical protein ACS0TY_036221 [Phlomoides rotata]